MPAIRSQAIVDGSLTVIGSTGRVFAVTRQELQARALEDGHDAVREWAVQALVDALGAEYVAPHQVDFEFNPADGRVLRLTLRSE